MSKDENIKIKINEKFELTPNRIGIQILINHSKGECWAALQSPFSLSELASAFRALASKLDRLDA